MSSDSGEEGATRRHEEEETIAELSDAAALHTYLSACALTQELQDIYTDTQDDLHQACQAQAQYSEQPDITEWTAQRAFWFVPDPEQESGGAKGDWQIWDCCKSRFCMFALGLQSCN